MPKHRYEIDGKSWVTLPYAAKLIGSNSQGVRKLIADGQLEHRQSRAGSRIIIVNLMQVAALRTEREQWRKERRPKPKAADQPPDCSVGHSKSGQRDAADQITLPWTNPNLNPWRGSSK